MSDALFLGTTTRRAFERLAADLRRVFGDRLIALVASSAETSVAFVDRVGAGDLDAIGPLVHAWRHDALDVPLLLTPDEFRRSLDAFPLEYQAVIDRHVVIAGRAPFDGVAVNVDHLRRACEVQAKGHLIHLRQGWAAAGHHHDALAALIARSASPLRALLANVARLEHQDGAHAADRTPIAGARMAGLPEPLVADVLALEDAPERAAGLVPQLPAYLDASERLWAFVDAWRPRSRA